MRGTKLRQQAGSPLISGTSRVARPFAVDWITAFLLSCALSLGAVALYLYLTGSVGSASLAFDILSLLAVVAPGCAIGSAVGIWVSKPFGARKPVVPGVICALCVVPLWYVVSSTVLSALGG